MLCIKKGIVGDGVLDVPCRQRRQSDVRENLPIEVKFFRRVVEDADPYVNTSVHLGSLELFLQLLFA